MTVDLEGTGRIVFVSVGREEIHGGDDPMDLSLMSNVSHTTLVRHPLPPTPSELVPPSRQDVGVGL